MIDATKIAKIAKIADGWLGRFFHDEENDELAFIADLCENEACLSG